MAIAQAFIISSYSAFVNKVASLNCPFVSTSGDTINIDNALTVTPGSGIKIMRNDTVLAATSVNWRGSGSYRVKQYIVVSDTFFYFQVRGYYENRAALVYEKIDDDSYYGVIASDGTATMPYKEISDITFYKVGEDSTKYFHGLKLDYTAQSGICNYTQDSLFITNNTTKYIPDPNLVACSTVEAQRKITMNNRDYFSLGKHSLIEMTS